MFYLKKILQDSSITLDTLLRFDVMEVVFTKSNTNCEHVRASIGLSEPLHAMCQRRCREGSMFARHVMDLKRLSNKHELLILGIEMSTTTECQQVSGCKP